MKQFCFDEQIDVGYGSDRAGYWEKINLYYYMHYVEDVNGYYKYYALTKDQYGDIKSGKFAAGLSPEERFTMARRYADDNRMIYCDSIRGYDIDRDFLISHKNAICRDDLYFYEESTIYMHIYWEGKHYAAIPLPHMFNPLRKREGIYQCFYMRDGVKEPICYGKRVEHIVEG